ncbi:unnamed protein product, partial [Prorocentrum cordatum]
GRVAGGGAAGALPETWGPCAARFPSTPALRSPCARPWRRPPRRGGAPLPPGAPQVRWDSDLVLCQSVSGWFCDDEASDDLGSERDLTQDFAHPARAGPWTGGRCRAASALAGAEAGRRQTAVSALPPQLPASARGDCARGSGGVAGASAPASEPRSSLGAAAADEEPDQELVLADTRVLLVCGALACFVGSVTAVYVALTHDPNRKEDRPLWRRGEYLAGASVVGALAMAVIAQRGGPK